MPHTCTWKAQFLLSFDVIKVQNVKSWPLKRVTALGKHRWNESYIQVMGFTGKNETKQKEKKKRRDFILPATLFYVFPCYIPDQVFC